MNLMPADIGAELWIRKWREMLDTSTAGDVPVEAAAATESQFDKSVVA